MPSLCVKGLGKADPASAHVPLVKALRYLAYPCRPRSGLRMEVSAFHAQCTPSRFQHWGGSQARVVLQAGSCPSPWGYPLVPLSVPFALTLAAGAWFAASVRRYRCTGLLRGYPAGTSTIR